MDTGITPVMNMGDNGMNGFMGIFGLLILLGILNGGFGGGWGGGNGNSNAIQNDINRGFDNQNLQAQSRDIPGAVSAGTAQSVAATNQVYHDIVNNLGDKYMELARDVAGVQGSVAAAIANQNECCCSTKLLIEQSKYENALQMAGLEQRLTSKMDQNEITSLRDQIQQLQLAQATSGMLRFPSAWTYNGGIFPPVTGGTTTA